MKAKSKIGKAARKKINAETLGVINSLAAVLVAATVKAKPKERALIAKEFARVLDILNELSAKNYKMATAAEKKVMEKRADRVTEETGKFASRSGVCCISRKLACQQKLTKEDCKRCDPDATYACLAAPIEDPVM